MARSSGEHQGRLAVVASGVDVGAVFEQKTHHLHMAVPSGEHQGRHTVSISGVDVHSSRNKQPYRRYIPRADALQKGYRRIGDPLLI